MDDAVLRGIGRVTTEAAGLELMLAYLRHMPARHA